MVDTESFSLSIFAQNCSTVPCIRHVKHIMVDFPSHNCDDGSTAAVVTVKHGHLTIYFLKNLFDDLIQLTPLVLLDFLTKFNWEHFLAVLRNCLSSMPIKDTKKSTGLVPGYLVHVTVGVLHLRPELSILVLGVSIFFHR